MRSILLGTAVVAALTTPAIAQTEVTLGRFFGACEDAGTDTTTSTGEACIIQSIINAASAEIDGVTVETLPTDWGNYYDQIKAAYAGGTAPDIHVMHRHRVPEFAGRRPPGARRGRRWSRSGCRSPFPGWPTP